MIKLLCILGMAIGSYGFNIQPRIINGILSNPTDFPYFVYFKTSSHYCSAVLLSDRYLTNELGN